MNKAGFTIHTLVPGIFLADKWESTEVIPQNGQILEPSYFDYVDMKTTRLCNGFGG